MKDLFENKTLLIGGAVILAAVVSGTIYIFSRHTQNLTTVPVQRMDLTESVTATGSVVPADQVSLAFSEQGTVSAVYVDVGSTTTTGEVLASLDSSAIRAELAGAQADVETAEAQLATAQNGATPQELAVYQQKYDDAASALVTAMKNAYLQAQDAVLNKSDLLFTNGNSPNPTISVRTQSTTEQYSIQNERAALGTAFASWQNALAALGTDPASTATSSLQSARDTTNASLAQIKSYLDDLGTIAGNLSVGNSGLSQATINGYVADVNGAAQEVTGATTAEQAADAAYSDARDSLTLEQTGSTSEDIQAAQAAVDKAKSEVEGYQSQLGHSSIVSPFDGVITAMNMDIGQVFVPGLSSASGIGIMSDAPFKVETYVPETDIGKIAVGDSATITFDAYGPAQSFPATVSLVDPAETVQNGVNTYKVTLAFSSPDPRIKSGLTANANIVTKSEPAALAIPSSAIITVGTSTFVLAKGSDGNLSQKQVQTGITTADGHTEILSGLNEGDQVAAFGSGSAADY